METIHFLISVTRLSDLEKLTERCLADKGSGEKKAQLLNQIKLIKRQRFELTSTVERGETILGGIIQPLTRGKSNIPKNILVNKVKMDRFYGKTLQINHR